MFTRTIIATAFGAAALVAVGTATPAAADSVRFGVTIQSGGVYHDAGRHGYVDRHHDRRGHDYRHRDRRGHDYRHGDRRGHDYRYGHRYGPRYYVITRAEYERFIHRHGHRAIYRPGFDRYVKRVGDPIRNPWIHRARTNGRGWGPGYRGPRWVYVDLYTNRVWY